MMASDAMSAHSPDLCRHSVRVQGRVQGVGFRPDLAFGAQCRTAGEVLNDSDGVLLRVSGDRPAERPSRPHRKRAPATGARGFDREPVIFGPAELRISHRGKLERQCSHPDRAGRRDLRGLQR